MANHRYNRLLCRMSGPYRVHRVQPHSVSIEEEGKPSTVSIKRLMLSPTRELVTEMPDKTTHTTRPQLESPEQRDAAKEKKEATRNNTYVPQKYVVSRLACYVDTPQGRRHVVREYGCRSGGETPEPPHHIPKYFIWQ